MNDMKPALRRVGAAAVRAAMTDAEVERDPARAFHVALAAMRATYAAAVEKPPG